MRESFVSLYKHIDSPDSGNTVYADVNETNVVRKDVSMPITYAC